jgi:subtilisin family serine protease
MLFLKSMLMTMPITPIKIAVIDTGFDLKSKWETVNPKICPNGTKNFFDKSIDVTDNRKHGTHVAGLIASNAAEANYCLYIFKAIDENVYNGSISVAALKQAIKEKVDIINYSAGGVSYIEEECAVITEALDRGIKVIVAAGNNGQDLRTSSYYPAKCDPRIIRVANLEANGRLNKSSNYSTNPKFNVVFEIGTNIKSIYPDNKYEVKSGTSMATAIISGKVAKQLWLIRIKKNIKGGSIPSRSSRYGNEKR